MEENVIDYYILAGSILMPTRIPENLSSMSIMVASFQTYLE